MNTHIIETENLTRRYGRHEAVRDLTLAVPRGSVCALLGANGAGKSTTIKLLMDLERPTRGTARVLGVDSQKLCETERRQIGYVAESQQLPLWMTVRQLLDYCRPFYPAWDRALEKKLLGEFALPENRKLSQLSRGMLMKAALLSSLAYRPKLLVLDEPFSGLDPLVRQEFVRGLLEVSAAEEWTVLVSSHEIEEVERLCDRVILLETGTKRVDETTESLLARFRRVEVTGASAQAVEAKEVLELEQAGALTRFVVSDFAGDLSERGWQENFPGAQVTARAMTLKEIFVVLARSAAGATKGVAA